MNELADELNLQLRDTVIGRTLSSLGRRMYFPRGIVAQTAEAAARASSINATVGMALQDNEPLITRALGALFHGLTPTEVVAYAPTAGVYELRQAWREEIRRKNPSVAGTPLSLPVVTAGLTNGIFHIAELFADAGDTVILPELHWGNYRLIFEQRRGATIVPVPLADASALRSELTRRSKAIVLLNAPNNPTGYSPSVAEAQAMRDAIVSAACAGTDIVVITDDAYFGLYYESETYKESLFSLLANAHERVLAVKIDGATKEEFAWGLRIGFVTIAGAGLHENHHEAFIKKLMGSIRASVSNCSRIGQSILIRLLHDPEYRDQRAEFRATLEERYRIVKERVKSLAPPLAPLPFNSGYFFTLDCGTVNAEELRLRLLDGGIGTISIGTRYLRVAYSTVNTERIASLLDEVQRLAATLAGSPNH